MSKNDITGDTLISKPSNDNYRNEHDRIFGKKREPERALTMEDFTKMKAEVDIYQISKVEGSGND